MGRPKRRAYKPKGLHRVISDEVASALQRAQVTLPPWWRDAETLVRPHSISGRHFTGINTLYLWCVARARGFGSATWATSEQWVRYGLRPAPWETPVSAVVYRALRVPAASGVRTLGPRIVRPRLVFNSQQLTSPAPRGPSRMKSRMSARELIQAVGAECDGAGSPDHEPSELAHNLLTTLVQWTGAPDRLARKTWSCETLNALVREQLIAEIGAAYISANYAVLARPDFRTIDTSLWVQLLRQDPRAVFSIAADAERAARYVGSIFRRKRGADEQKREIHIEPR